jgi:hypothetical protein
MASSFLPKQRPSRSPVSIAMVVCTAVLVMALSLVLGGCGKASLVGKWLDATDNTTVEFRADGKVLGDEFQGVDATYKTADGKIVVSVAGAEYLSMEYTLDGDTLTVKDPTTGDPRTSTRVK